MGIEEVGGERVGASGVVRGGVGGGEERERCVGEVEEVVEG